MLEVSEEQFYSAVSEYATATAKGAKIKAKMEAEITAIRSKYQPDLEVLGNQCKDNIETMYAYATEHKAVLFSKVRHIDTVHGEIGFRLGTPKLKTLPKFTWVKVLENVKRILPDYVRTTHEVDKERLLGDRTDETIAPHLNDLGVYVTQDETFYIKLKKEEAATL